MVHGTLLKNASGQSQNVWIIPRMPFQTCKMASEENNTHREVAEVAAGFTKVADWSPIKISGGQSFENAHNTIFD